MAAQDAPSRCLDALKESASPSTQWVEVFAQRLPRLGSSSDAGGINVDFQPPATVDGVFTSGEHKVSSGVYIAKGDAKVTADGNAVVYGFDQSSIDAKDKSTIYLSDKSTGQMNGEGIIYARQDATAYGFDRSIVFAFDRVEVHGHDAPLILGFGHTDINANDNSTTCSFENAYTWARNPMSPDMDRVLAFDNSVVATSASKVDGKDMPMPKITLKDDALWVESEPQFHNPVMHRTGNTP